MEIADGQTVTDLDVSDLLPNNLAFLSVIATSPPGGTVTQTPTVGAAANPPDNDLVVRFPTVTGGAGTDASVTFEFFVPRVDANGDAVISPPTGASVTSQNETSAVGDWAPDGGTALELLAQHEAPDAVLLAMCLPRCDGALTLSAIRSNPRWAGLKVFAVSGKSPAELGIETGPAGINRWFPKPINPETLVRELSRELSMSI